MALCEPLTDTLRIPMGHVKDTGVSFPDQVPVYRNGTTEAVLDTALFAVEW